MNYRNVKWLLVAASLLLCSLAGSCGFTIKYWPPFIPVEVSYDIINKKLQVSISGRIQTPIGGLGAAASAGSSPEKFAGVRTLTIESGTDRYVYQLEKGKSYSISLPSDVNGGAKVIYSGTDDNLSIVIPNPAGEDAGDLLRRLNEEREAARRTEEEARASAKKAQAESRMRAKRRAVEAPKEPSSRPRGS